MRRLVFTCPLVCPLVCLLICCNPVEGQTVAELRTHVEYFASDELGGRYPASEGIQKAQDYIRAECKTIGLQTYTQDVTTSAGTCKNIIAILPGARDDMRLVFSAHLDHLGEGRRGVYNGADDNASGSAAILALARQAKKPKKPWGCTIEFIWYTGEEMGLVGSKAYVARPLAELDQYKLVLNLDMVGRLRASGEMSGAQKFPYSDVISKLEDQYGMDIIYWGSGSDHKSWDNRGIPAITLNTGLHRDYHQPTDDAHKINYDGMVKVCQYAMEFADIVDSRLLPPGPNPSPSPNPNPNPNPNKPNPYILR
jgi:Zn-dependent M28 family amino/carboxypeptidase